MHLNSFLITKHTKLDFFQKKIFFVLFYECGRRILFYLLINQLFFLKYRTCSQGDGNINLDYQERYSDFEKKLSRLPKNSRSDSSKLLALNLQSNSMIEK